MGKQESRAEEGAGRGRGERENCAFPGKMNAAFRGWPPSAGLAATCSASAPKSLVPTVPFLLSPDTSPSVDPVDPVVTPRSPSLALSVWVLCSATPEWPLTVH